MSHTFKDCAKVISFVYGDERRTLIHITEGHVRDMEISLEPGHMSLIPFVKVTHQGGAVSMIPATAGTTVLAPTAEAQDEGGGS